VREGTASADLAAIDAGDLIAAADLAYPLDFPLM